MQQQQQKVNERRGLSILHEEDESRKQTYGCDNISRHSQVINDHSDNKKPLSKYSKGKRRVLRKKMNKIKSESVKNEEKNLIKLKVIDYDGDDEVSDVFLSTPHTTT